MIKLLNRFTTSINRPTSLTLFILPRDDKSRLVKTMRPIKNSLQGSEVNNDKSLRSIKAKVVVPADFLPSAQVEVKKSRTVFFFRIDESDYFLDKFSKEHNLPSKYIHMVLPRTLYI